jgi:hypothetical protein
MYTVNDEQTPDVTADPNANVPPEMLDPDGPFGVKAEYFVKVIRDSHRVVAANVFRLRGEFIANVAALEDAIDFALSAFFEVPKHKSLEFKGWLLTNLGVADKVAILRRITNAKTGDFLQGLSSAPTRQSRSGTRLRIRRSPCQPKMAR